MGSKQKAAESRQLEQILRTATRKYGYPTPTGPNGSECYLKDNLCLSCPRCGLFGATSVESGKEDRANIKHRIEYSTAFSLSPFEDIESAITFNAIDDQSQTTGQALGSRYVVNPGSLFPSIITLRSATYSEFILTVKTLLSCKSYGAESRIGGDVRNTIYGIVGGWEEIITSLELTLSLADSNDAISGERVVNILEEFKKYAGNPQAIQIFTPSQVDEIIKDASNTEIDLQFIEKTYNDVKEYRAVQQGAKKAKADKGKGKK